MGFFASLFRRKKLEDVLFETKVVKVSGLSFEIRKINILDHLAGANMLRQIYEVHKMDVSKNMDHIISDKKIRQHFSEVLTTGVVSPVLVMDNDGKGIWVERIFNDWGLVNELYEAIISFTYGKKKVKLS